LFGVATIFGSLGLLFLSRIGAGIAGATISTAQAYIADTTTLEKRPKGMALIGMAFGLGFTLGPLVGFLAVLGEQDAPLPWPGFVAAGLSAVALLLAVFKLPESLKEGSEKAARKLFDFHAFRLALSTPSVAFVLFAIFVCVFSFANFETTLSLLIKDSDRSEGVFKFSSWQVCLTFAYIGLTLAIVQGGIVRRVAGRISEGTLAATGAFLEVVGFGLMILAIRNGSVPFLMLALAVVVTGFSLMQPSLNSLLSRRSDPAKQGTILGVGQSVNSLARIIGAGIGIPLLRAQLELPYYVATALMLIGMVLVVIASRSGRDYVEQAK
jgi:DHA1 family tetracycline resistance protein-like MFS transporter